MDSVIFIIFVLVAMVASIFLLLEVFSRPPLKHIFFGLVSVILGLIVGTLLADPLSKLPSFWGEYLPLAVSLAFAIAGLLLYRKLVPTIDHWIDSIVEMFGIGGLAAALGVGQHRSLANDVVVDTSAIIDGRVLCIARLGYLPQKVVVPRFVLSEIQNIADSKDSDRRNKGKRALLVVEELKGIKGVLFRVADDDFTQIQEVDTKLVLLTKKLHAQLMTTDYNLNKVAAAENIKVLNVNELAQQLRAQLLPGDEITIRLVHLGKDKSQAVGYLPDGTMVIVENAGNMLDKEVTVKIVRAIQTAAGKMYFSKLRNKK